MGLKAAPVSDDAPAWPSRKAALAKKTRPAKEGICIKTVQAWRGVDSIDKVFINCVCHPAIEDPMYMGHPVDDDYLDTKGFESLRVRPRPRRPATTPLRCPPAPAASSASASADRMIANAAQLPLLVGQPRKWDDEDGVTSTCVDVIFHPRVTDRCWKPEGAPGLGADYYKTSLAALAKKFVIQDTGLTLSKRHLVFKRCRYKGADPETNGPLRFELPEDCWAEGDAAAAPPPDSSSTGGGGLVQEVEEVK